MLSFSIFNSFKSFPLAKKITEALIKVDVLLLADTDRREGIIIFQPESDSLLLLISIRTRHHHPPNRAPTSLCKLFHFLSEFSQNSSEQGETAEQLLLIHLTTF